MARGVNKVILVGNLGDDPAVKQMPNGEMVANFSLATSESWRDRQTGQKVERTEWHRVTMYRKLAEIAGQYLRKGSKVYLEGKLQTRKWQDKQGQDRYTTEVVIDVAGQMQMLDRRGDEMPEDELQQSSPSSFAHSQQSNFNAPQQSFSQRAPQPSAQQKPISESASRPSDQPTKEAATTSAFSEFDDDIPF